MAIFGTFLIPALVVVVILSAVEGQEAAAWRSYKGMRLLVRVLFIQW